ncbi:MAG: ROK family protein [Alistipes shahii]
MDGESPYYGKDGYSGEFGHVHMYNNSILCHCGKRVASKPRFQGRAIHRKLIERINNGESSGPLARKVRKGAVITTNDHPSEAGRDCR